MKKIILCFALLLFAAGSAHAHGRVGVSFGFFYSSLGSHGEWISMDGGVYAWRPFRVATGWRPYTVGRWAWTDDGWYWYSDEPWGWATYHYGRWYYDDYYGWVWVPGYDWAPAWVEWRYGDGCVGWAPLSPYAVFSVSYGVYYRRHWATPISYWTFVDCGHITYPSVHRYVYRQDSNSRFFGRTRTGGNIRYEGRRIVSHGPGRDYVERTGRIRVERAEVRDVDDSRHQGITRDGSRERIDVYRPRIEDTRRPDTREAPVTAREGERRIGIETGDIDVRLRHDERTGSRDMERAEEYRRMEQSRTAERERTSDNGSIGNESRSQERSPQVRQQEQQRQVTPQRQQTERRSPEVNRERAPRQETRSASPERTVRRGESREQKSGNERGGSGRRR